jgi:Protein of unknown function (DUF2738)
LDIIKQQLQLPVLKANFQNQTFKSKMSAPIVLTVNDWVPSQIKYMPPKVNERGGKAISMISTQTKRSLHISTPMMMTWGIADFINENGESDGKYSMSLNFPSEEYRKPATDAFLDKVKAFESQILDDAVKNSELWWGEEMSREVCKHTFFPFLKYTKNKDTKKIDPTKPPSIRAKVSNYDSRWNIELYDTKNVKIFPLEGQDHLTPMDFVSKLSQVACVLQCGGIWIGGKGWGVTWRVIQCVVKPREVVSIYGKCHIQLSDDERGAIETQTIRDDVDVEEEESVPATVFKAPVPVDTTAEDSDEEETVVPTLPTVPEPTLPTVPVVTATAPSAPSAPSVKKVVKKAAEPVATEAPAPSAPSVKKVVKKKA